MNHKRKSYGWYYAIKCKTTEEKIRICLFSDFQKSHKGKHHTDTELVCIIGDVLVSCVTMLELYYEMKEIEKLCLRPQAQFLPKICVDAK